MSTPPPTPSLSITDQDNEYNYKKTLGVSYVYPSYPPNQEPYSSLPFIFNSQIMTNTVPLQAPVFDSSSVVTGPSGGSGGTGVKYTSSTYPYIAKYVNLPLTNSTTGAESLNYAYSYSSTQDPSYNLTIQAIPPDYDPNGSYPITISAYNTNNGFIPVSSAGSNSWIFDCTTGYVTFTSTAWSNNYNSTNGYDNYPYITFYRYEGPFGLDSSGSSQWTTTTSGNNIYNNNSGNVGIGTASPGYTLDVNGNTRINQNTYLATTSGNVVGIGTTSPNTTYNKLDVRGRTTVYGVGTDTSGCLSFTSDTSGNNFIQTGLSLTSGSVAPLYFTNIFSTGAPIPYLMKIDTSGNVTAQTFTTTSDYRMKKDIRNIDKIFNVDNLNPVIYRLKNNDQIQTGFIAHELQEYYPFLVNGEKDGSTMQSINYSGLIPILVKEIQELKRQINILKNK